MGVASLTFKTTLSGIAGGSGTKTVDGNAAEIANPSVPAAVSGTLSTRTDNDTGTLTMSTGHGITTGQRIDLYWAGGSRYGVTVGTVATNSVPFDLGSGDNLPVQGTAVTVGKPVQTAFDVTGDNITALALVGAGAGYRTRFVFASSAPADVATVLVAAGEIYAWTGSGTNPLAGLSPATVWISHESTAGAVTGCKAVAVR